MVQRIFRGKDVLCKYPGHGTPSIGKGSKVMFCVSRSGCEVAGEATIKALEFLTPSDLLSKYERRLFITKRELEEYRRERSSERKLMVLVLSRIMKFDVPLKLRSYVTMAGQTLTRAEYEKILPA